MSRYFITSVAATALMAVLAAPVMAQTAPGEHAPAAQSEAGPAVELPQVLRDLGLSDVTTREGRHGMRVQGKLSDGTEIQAMLDEKGELRGLRGEDDAALPQSLVERLVPQAVRSQQIYGELGQIDAIFVGGRGVMVSGKDAQSNSIRAAFAEDGTLLRFGRGNDDRPDMNGDRQGKPGDRGRAMGPKDHDRKGHDKDRKDHDGKPRDGKRGPDRESRGAPQGEPLSPDQIRASLTEAGYTAIGQILQQGPITVAQATNPEAEPVLVEIGVDGKVLRELNR